MEVMDKFMALIALMVSWVYSYPQTYQVVYITYVQLFICESHLNKVVFFKERK